MTAKLYHADLYGTRKSKYDALHDSDMGSIAWEALDPNAPYYLFMPQEQAYREEYEAGCKVTDLFTTTAQGFKSHRDDFAVAFTLEEAQERLRHLVDHEVSEPEFRRQYDLKDTKTWSFHQARELLSEVTGVVQRCMYRPFDLRYCLLHQGVMDRPRTQSQAHMLKPNIGLATTRNVEIHDGFQHILCTNYVMDGHAVSLKEIDYLFPLWSYPTDQEAAFGLERRANINPKFLSAVAAKIATTPTPEEIFHYAYAVFHAPTYRSRYAAFLKTDFPRLPLPPDAATFTALAALGAKLTALHLLEAPGLSRHGIGYKGGGKHLVKKMREAERYVAPTSDGATGRVRLNDTEYFDNVPPEAWEFQVGGYRPAAKWLDDRKDRALTEDDITHYRRMIAAMRDTAALLPAVDAAFQPILTNPAQDASE